LPDKWKLEQGGQTNLVGDLLWREGLVTLEGLSRVLPFHRYSCDFRWECLILGQFITMEDGEVMTA